MAASIQRPKRGAGGPAGQKNRGAGGPAGQKKRGAGVPAGQKQRSAEVPAKKPRTTWIARLGFLAACLALVVVRPSAHDIPASVLVQAFAKPEGERLRLLVRLPLVHAVVVMLFGAVLRLPQWVQDLSPFEHLPLVPAQEFEWQPFAAVLLVAAGLVVAAQVAFRRRDLH